jgi:hypothetical protein
MSVWLRKHRTDVRLWGAIAVVLFVLGGFVNPCPMSKASDSLWGLLGILIRGDYVCSSGELVFATLLYAVLMSIPALVFGWLLQALWLVAVGILKGDKAATMR